MIIGIATAITINNNVNQTQLRQRRLLGLVPVGPCPIKQEVGQMKRAKLVDKTRFAIAQNAAADLSDFAREARRSGMSPRDILKRTFKN